MEKQNLTPPGKIIKGYKITDNDMQCRGFQYELGKWYEHDGDVVVCESGFHFCEYPSGPWAYYDEGRVFECEAEMVLLSTEPGASRKHVAKKIRLVREITIAEYLDIDYENLGNRNIGNKNTGHGNTGNSNTGDCNTGDRNTGNLNVGNRNTGNENTGNSNTGNRNIGSWNTGCDNIGKLNIGSWNIGNKNTGNGNVGDHHSGSLCYGSAPFFMFNLPANRDDVNWELVSYLSELMQKDDPIDPVPFLSLPNATPRKIAALHHAHIQARKVLLNTQNRR